MRKKEKGDDWIWVIDHSIQMGQHKCLVILGIRQRDLPHNRALAYKDMEPIDVVPVRQSNGSIVHKQLEAATKKTGVPCCIVEDKGTDLKAGTDKFCLEHPEVRCIYDVRHKMAALLKRVLTKDIKWEEFTKLVKRSKQQVQQTALAGLMAPKQRTKARYMNTEHCLKWGKNIIQLLLESNETIQNKDLDPEKVREKFSWLFNFTDDLERWWQLLEIIKATEKFVTANGFQNDIDQILLEELNELDNKGDVVVDKFKDDVMAYVKDENAKARPGERLLGSSVIIESIFGAQKNIENEQSRSGFTGLLLALPAMLSKTTVDIVHKAMESTPAKKISEWAKDNIGISVQASRKSAFDFLKETEQKVDQLPATG